MSQKKENVYIQTRAIVLAHYTAPDAGVKNTAGYRMYFLSIKTN